MVYTVNLVLEKTCTNCALIKTHHSLWTVKITALDLFSLTVAAQSSERRLERLNRVVHERLPFSTVKISHSASTVFEESVSN